jgi:hypothetical protein
MKRAFLALVLAWPPGVIANTSHDADAGSLLVAAETVRLTADAGKPHPAAQRDLARADGITWSAPFYRYGGREPTLEELPGTRRPADPGSEAATHLQPPR